jgi:hypothetical protein
MQGTSTVERCSVVQWYSINAPLSGAGDRTPRLIEGGKGMKPMAVHFQLRPDPLAKSVDASKGYVCQCYGASGAVGGLVCSRG